jgi:hypothetical protein
VSALNFPSSPANGEIYGNYQWNDSAGVWELLGGPQGPQGPQGATGANGTYIEASTTGPTVGDGDNGDLWIVYS